MFWKKKKQPEIPQVPAIPKVKELEGIEIGNIVCNRDEVSLNLFDKTLHNNSDASFFGGPASGMDFKAKLYSLRYFKQGKQIITITPYCSETDFKYMCQKIGGQIVKVNYDLDARLNIFDIYERKDFMGALLQEKIASLKALFRTMYPKMSYEEEMALGAALLTTYNNKGITVENDTIYRNGMQKCKAFPTMGDLYTTIKDMPEISQVLENFLKFLREYVDGEYFWYNSETTINPYNRYIVFDMERINMTNIEKEDKNFMYSACFEFINERLKQDADMQKVVVLRNMESMLIGKKSNMLISLCQNLHRNARDYNCAVLDFVRVIGDETQNVYIREVAGNAAVKFFLEQKKTNIETMQKNLCLTEEQIKQIEDMRYKFSMWMSIYSYWLYMEVNATEEEIDTIEDRTRPEFWGTPVTAEELARRPVSLRVALYLARQYYAASGETVLRAWEHPDYWLFYGAKSSEKPCAKNQPVSVSKWTSELKSIFWLSKSSKKLFDEAKEIKSNIITRDDAYTYSEKAKPITQNSPTK